MASRGMFATTDLIEPLARRGIRLSSSQVYRLVADRPERLSLKILMALLDILDCPMSELIEPVAAGEVARTAKAAGGAAVWCRRAAPQTRPYQRRRQVTGAAAGTRCARRPGRRGCRPPLRRPSRALTGRWPMTSCGVSRAAVPSAAGWLRRCWTSRRCWPTGVPRRLAWPGIC